MVASCDCLPGRQEDSRASEQELHLLGQQPLPQYELHSNHGWLRVFLNPGSWKLVPRTEVRAVSVQKTRSHRGLPPFGPMEVQHQPSNAWQPVASPHHLELSPSNRFRTIGVSEAVGCHVAPSPLAVCRSTIAAKGCPRRDLYLGSPMPL
ncbi:hypothetical protein NDU88_007362 [Pleurodeles waltl]|uniref:Uncharacterized protein n=1 Tax=Pleurodeles waltl TaxID=8319 RepID=A0AAV7U2V3_PLEWA|nr:hypothetical protein NDU88_007362 [Pleurodeles waltl]